MSNIPEPTVEEIIATLEHSNIPTVIVEGRDDVIIYRTLEDFIDNQIIDVLPVKGRKAVLEIFDEKRKADSKLNDKVIAFIADKDIWCNTGIPSEYIDSALIFTNGYSLENDVFIDYGCQGIIIRNADISKFNEDREKFIHWYALALQATLNNIDERQEAESVDSILPDRKISKHPNEILNNYDALIELKPNETYPNDLKQQLYDEFPVTIRGKSLLALFTMTCSNHKDKAIFEVVAERRGDCIQDIFEQVALFFNEYN